MLLMLPLHLAVMPVFCSSFLKTLFSPHSPTFIQKFLTKFFFVSQPLKMYKFSIKIRSLSLKPMFTRNHWHRTVVLLPSNGRSVLK